MNHLILLRPLLILSLTGVAFAGRAQSTLEAAPLDDLTTEAGKCILANDSVYIGKMKFVPNAQASLTTITHLNIFPNGKKVKRYTYQVKSFTIDQRYFIATSSSGERPTQKEWQAANDGFFVQLTDTGRLWLGRRYRTFGGGGGMMIGSDGLMHGSGYSPSGTSYDWVLRRRKSGPWETIPDPNNQKGTNKKFRKMLAPYFADRPDLLQSLEGEALDYKRVDQAIRGYNSGEAVFFLDHDY